MAGGEICVVMDADLSHSVEAIPDMIKPIIEKKADMTLGSRYIKGDRFQDSSFIRKIISKVAGLLARGITNTTDPTSGFMAIRKSILKDMNLDPIGWKLPLEIIVKAGPRVVEVPIIFTTRQKGKSKLNLKVGLKYIQHLFNLYCYKFPTTFEFFKFSLVGLAALLIDTAVLISCVELLFLDPRLSAVFAFIVSATINYFLNRFWTFKIGKFTIFRYSYPSFILIRLVGLFIRISTMHILIEYAGMGKGHLYILASLMGIFVAAIFNFLGSKYVAFSKLFLHRSKIKE